MHVEKDELEAFVSGRPAAVRCRVFGDADGLNHETEKYLAVTAEQIRQQAQKVFRKDNSSTLVYLADKS